MRGRILVTVILWVHFCLRLVNYALSSAPTELLLALMTIVLQILLAGFFALTTARLDSVLQAIVMGIGIVLLGVTLSAGWGAAYVRPADPRELLVVKPTAMGIHDLVQTLRDLSWHRTGMPTTLPVTFESAPDSVLAWYLRDFGAAHRVESLEGLTAGDVVPVVVTARRDWTLPDGGEYAGQDFALRSDWSIQQVGCTWGWPPQCSAAAGWLFLRHTTTPPTFDQWAVLWLRQDVQDAAVSRP